MVVKLQLEGDDRQGQEDGHIWRHERGERRLGRQLGRDTHRLTGIARRAHGDGEVTDHPADVDEVASRESADFDEVGIGAV